MDVTPLVRKGQQIIQSYAGGIFKVNGNVYENSILVTPEETTNWEICDVSSVDNLKAEHFDVFIKNADAIDVVLLGCGKNMTFISPVLRQELREKGLNVDVMDTGAACRTYNVLMAEGRRVVCALLPV